MGLSSQLAASSLARPGVCTSSTRPASPYEGQVIYETDTDLLRIWNGSAWRTLAFGTPTNGAVLQTVNATYTTEVGNSTSTFADTGLSASITPTSTSSKVLVTVSQAGCGKNSSNSGTGLSLRLVRGSTEIIIFENIAAYTGTAVQNYIGTVSCSYLDSPATTSATTYKTQFRNVFNGSAVYVQGNTSSSSTITLMEIAA